MICFFLLYRSELSNCNSRHRRFISNETIKAITNSKYETTVIVH